MLNPGYKFQIKEKKIYPPLPEDIYCVELFDIDMDTVVDKKSGEKRDVLKFQFVVLDAGEYRGRSIWKNYVPTYLWEVGNDKNALYQITKAMIQRDMTLEEMMGFTSDKINMLVGFQCRVTTVNKVGTGLNSDKTYTNIDKFLPKKEALPKLTDEEKEKATVKAKPEATESTMPTPAPVMDSEIPLIGQEEVVEVAIQSLGGKVVGEVKPTAYGVGASEAPDADKMDISKVPF